MTKHLASDERRLQVADALLAVVARRGLDKATIRDVAEEAGVSVGLVQRYFRTKSDLLRFGIQVVYERAIARVQEVEIKGPVDVVMTRIAESMLPLDEARNREFRVALAFWQAALHDSEMAATHQQAMRNLFDGLVEAFTGAQSAGAVVDSVDPATEARALIALVDGLALHATLTGDVFDSTAITGALRAHFNRLFISPT